MGIGQGAERVALVAMAWLLQRDVGETDEAFERKVQELKVPRAGRARQDNDEHAVACATVGYVDIR